MKEIQLLCYVIPIGMCSGSHHPPPNPISPFLGTPYRQGLHPSAPASTPTVPKTMAPNLGLISPLYCARG